MTKIVELSVEAVKRITAAHINPDGSLVIIGGRNAQGKSSVLDSIAYALGGKKLIPSEPLRRGEKKGKVSVKLDNGVTITRTFTETGGGTLKIRTEDGMQPQGAQGWLDARIGALSFDPTAFLRDKDQAATLRELCGVDTTEIDTQRKNLYSERTEIGRDGKRAKGAADSAVHHDDAPDQEVSVADLMEARREASAKHAEHADAQRGISELRDQAERKESDAHRIHSEADEALARATDEAEDLRKRAQQIVDDAESIANTAKTRAVGLRKESKTDSSAAAKAEGAAKKLAAKLPDIGAIDEQIASADVVNSKVRDNATKARLDAEVLALRKQWDDKTAEITALDQQRADMLAAAKMPVDGLGINDDGVVTFNDFELSEASQAEQIRVSIGIGAALSPDLRIILIRRGSDLDADGMALVAELANEHDAQVWIERVGDADDGAIVIEDGQVKA